MLVITSLLGFFIGTGSLLLFLMMLIDNDFRWIIYFTPVLSIGSYLMTYHTVDLYCKNAPIIGIDSNSISFNKETFLLTDLKHIEFTGKRSFSFLFSYDMESAKLQFGNGQTKYIYDSMYQNAWEIKTLLKQVAIEKKRYTSQKILQIDTSELRREWFDTFKGNQFLSLKGISLCLYTYHNSATKRRLGIFSVGCCILVLFLFLADALLQIIGPSPGGKKS